jgi:UDP-glucose 4-epimerase
MRSERFFIAGGAGFIGSHFVDRLLGREDIRQVTVYDNFSSGQKWHLQQHASDPRLTICEGEISDLRRLTDAMIGTVSGHDVVIHLASNPDIARAATDPTIDFVEGTALTQNILEAMRLAGVPRILYASGSGVYGDLGEHEAHEDHGPLKPVSTYGASKFAGEMLISAYVHMFDMSGCAFRFGNVVGPRQTHGVGMDFLSRLMADPTKLRILGDGTQSKSYVHVTDIVSAVLLANERTVEPMQAYNVATGDYITVRQIAETAIDFLQLSGVELQYTGGNRGWKGDVPMVRLNTDRIRALGWKPARGSREAIRASLEAMHSEFLNVRAACHA